MQYYVEHVCKSTFYSEINDYFFDVTTKEVSFCLFQGILILFTFLLFALMSKCAVFNFQEGLKNLITATLVVCEYI